MTCSPPASCAAAFTCCWLLCGLFSCFFFCDPPPFPPSLSAGLFFFFFFALYMLHCRYKRRGGGTPKAVNFHTFSRNKGKNLHAHAVLSAGPSSQLLLTLSLEHMHNTSPLARQQRLLDFKGFVSLGMGTKKKVFDSRVDCAVLRFSYFDAVALKVKSKSNIFNN